MNANTKRLLVRDANGNPVAILVDTVATPWEFYITNRPGLWYVDAKLSDNEENIILTVDHIDSTRDGEDDDTQAYTAYDASLV